MHEDQPRADDISPETPKDGWCYDDYRQWRSEHAWQVRWAWRRLLQERQNGHEPEPPAHREPPAEGPPK